MQLKYSRELLTRHDYPATAGQLSDAFGDRVLELQNGTETVGEVYARLPDETYRSAEEAWTALYGAVGSAAIGRYGYSDRDPSPIGTGAADALSF